MTAHAIAVDVGGTEIKAALVAVGADGARPLPGSAAPPRAARAVARRPTGSSTPWSRWSRHCAARARPTRSAWSSPASSTKTGVWACTRRTWGGSTHRCATGWPRLDLPLGFGHDVRAGGLAEARFGAFRGMRDAVVLPIGTGIAAALVLDGRVHAANGHAGEIGHVDVGHGEPCPCGGTGCVEAVASSAAVARRYTARTGLAVDGGAEVAEAVRAGDADARAVWSEAVDALARGLLVLTAVVAPEGFVLGGGLARAGRLLTDPLRERLDDLLAAHHRRPRLELAELGDTAGCLGAALLATERLKTP